MRSGVQVGTNGLRGIPTLFIMIPIPAQVVRRSHSARRSVTRHLSRIRPCPHRAPDAFVRRDMLRQTTADVGRGHVGPGHKTVVIKVVARGLMEDRLVKFFRKGIDLSKNIKEGK